LSRATLWAILCAGLIHVINQSLLDIAVAGNRMYLPGIFGNTVVRGSVQLTNPCFLCTCDLPVHHR